MDKKSLDEFFAQAEDVLTDWPIKNLNDLDAANTEDPGLYELGDDEEGGVWPRCSRCGDRHLSIADLLGDFLTVVFSPPDSQDVLVMLGFDLAVRVTEFREDDTVVVVDVGTDPAIDTSAGPLTIPSGSIIINFSDSGDENIASPS